MLAGCWMVEEDIWKESFETERQICETSEATKSQESFEDYNGTQV